MELIAYKQQHSMPDCIPALSILKSGIIRFNNNASQKIGLKEGDKISFYQDKDQPLDWYFKIGEEGATLRKPTVGKGFVINFRHPAKLILDQFKKDKIQIRVATTPVEGGYYAIITRSV